MKAAAIFRQIQEHIAANPDIVKKVKAIYQWNITKDGETAAKWSEQHNIIISSQQLLVTAACRSLQP